MMSRTYLPEWPPPRRDKNHDQWISHCVMRQVIEDKRKKDNEKRKKDALEREKKIMKRHWTPCGEYGIL